MKDSNWNRTIKIIIVHRSVSLTLRHMIDIICACNEMTIECVNLWEEEVSLHAGDRVLLAYDVEGPWIPNEIISLYRQMEQEKECGNPCENLAMGLLTASSSALFTKTVARMVIERFNQIGIHFPGQPVVEATGQLENLSKWVKHFDKTESEILTFLCQRLAREVSQWNVLTYRSPRLVVIHGSRFETSNTLAFWKEAYAFLDPILKENYSEINLFGKQLNDCVGCAFDVCVAHGKKGNCHFNDFITNEVYQPIREGDVIVWLCPNYNDTLIGAQITLINRLTVIYRSMSFKEKMIYALVVSGNSGGDSVAGQLIGSLNVNKGFALPGGFVHYETANAPLSILERVDMNEHAKAFAEKINKCIEKD